MNDLLWIKTAVKAFENDLIKKSKMNEKELGRKLLDLF